ncbi:MAG: hypothetical protein KDA28_00305, partial [Phycisphaerales bacterium]|nr:hypothetical protein [Phycisphaerales bacterium]
MRPRHAALAALFLVVSVCAGQDGFVPLFNGTNLDGWHGLVGNPIQRASMEASELEAARKKADAAIAEHWRVENGEIVNDGSGPHLCTDAH